MNPRFTKEQLQRYRAAFELDKPLYVQYGLFYQRLFTGQLRAFKDNQPVLPKIVERAWNSLPLFVVGTSSSGASPSRSGSRPPSGATRGSTARRRCSSSR